jgi:hypothetical protein
VHELQKFSGTGSRVRSEGFSPQLAFDATDSIALPGHRQSVGKDLWQDLQSLETDMYQAAVP